MFTKILVPLDGSEVARRALAPAKALARWGKTPIVLARVPELAYMIVPGDGVHALLYPEQSLDYSAGKAAEFLETLRVQMVAEGLTVETIVPRGDVSAAIVEAAMEAEADLIVMSSHGYSGVSRWLLGSVAEKVLGIALCPVLVVRSDEPLRHMLVPLDGSALSEEAVEPALALAAGLGAKVTLFKAVPTLDRDEVQRLNQFEPGFGWRVERDMTDEAAAYLAEVSRRHAHEGVTVETVVRFEPAAGSILDFAEARGIDLVAMATHGRTGLRRWVYGSVTEKVLRGGHHSMLVVRPPGLRLAHATAEAAAHMPEIAAMLY
jgi:nucleotide-binding universal stress UspA family protein